MRYLGEAVGFFDTRERAYRVGSALRDADDSPDAVTVDEQDGPIPPNDELYGLGASEGEPTQVRLRHVALVGSDRRLAG